MLGIPAFLVGLGLVMLFVSLWRMRLAQNIQSKYDYFLTNVGHLKAQIEEAQKLCPKAVQTIGKVRREYPVSLIQSYRDYSWHPDGIEEFSILPFCDDEGELSPLLLNWPDSLKEDVLAELASVRDEVASLLLTPAADFVTENGLREGWDKWHQLKDRFWKANTAVLIAVEIEDELKKAFGGVKEFLERSLLPELEAAEAILEEKKSHLLPEFYDQVKRYCQEVLEENAWIQTATVEDKKDWFKVIQRLPGKYVKAWSLKKYLSARSAESPVTEEDMPYIKKYGIV